ncbi:MAG: hypothetical protein U9P79_04205 [Candidatus Cloacimonadota bacterium]|nr:hypothetical protein [Candidatus Cloacimonadota bacterium]
MDKTPNRGLVTNCVPKQGLGNKRKKGLGTREKKGLGTREKKKLGNKGKMLGDQRERKFEDN